MAHMEMKDKANVGFSVHTCVIETCHVKCSNNNNIIKHLRQIYWHPKPMWQQTKICQVD